MLFSETIKTVRLRLERLCPEMVDVFEVHAMYSRQNPSLEEVTEYLP